MTTKKKYELLKALEAVAAACENLSAIERTLTPEDRESWNDEAVCHLAGFSKFAEDGGTVGAFLNPTPDDWCLKYL